MRAHDDRRRDLRREAAYGRLPGHSFAEAIRCCPLGRATPGHRNHTLNQTAFKVYRYVASGILTDDQVTAAFTEAALTIGLRPAEVARTLASARTAGLANPRGVPAGPGRKTEEDGS